jgi:FKBP-type peptidyl-prolyl cis-trans isomerase SlyD
MKIEKDKVVHIHYTLTNGDDELIDTTDGKGPLAYIHGYNYVITGLETELTNKVVGDKFETVIKKEDAYGEYDMELVYIVPKKNFDGGEGELEVGMQVQVDVSEDQKEAIALVTKIEGEEVTLDLNHPLSGEELHFDVEVVEVRDATSEELDHGHVHGPGGVEHN